MNAREAKKITQDFLTKHHIPFDKLTAKTVSLSDLARTSVVFVTIHGWKPSPYIKSVRAFAKQHNFIVETDHTF